MTDPTRAYYRLRTARNRFHTLPENLTPQQRQLLDQLVERQLQIEDRVLQTPQAAGYVVSDTALRQAMEAIEGQYPSCDEFLHDLERVGLTVSQLSDLLERQQRVEGVLELCSEEVPGVTSREARRYYDAHPEKFLKPERRQVWHLLITVNPSYPENCRERVQARLEAIREATASDLTLFQQQARLHSECPSSLQGGELGWLPRGHLFPAIDEALFALPEGGISPVVETEIGLHLVYCNAIEAGGPLPFGAVAETIRETLTQAYKQKHQLDWLRSLA